MPRKVLTCDIPAPAYDEALAFCNARRKDAGKRPARRMPPGVPGVARKCPCAALVGGLVIYGDTWHPVGDERTRYGGPEAFVEAFDPAGANALKASGSARRRLVLPIRKEV